MLDSTDHPALRQIALRQPRLLKSQALRGVSPQQPLLPVFFAGEENRFASFVCGASDPNDGDETFPDLLAGMGPLLLVGPSGSGKTALANHLAARFSEQSFRAGPDGAGPDIAGAEPNVCWCMPAIDFARLYARAVDADDISQFRNEIQSVAVLVIDDVQSIVDKPAAQEELAARLEARSNASLPTILTCRRLPTQVPGLRPLLVSRMLPGLTIPLRLPGREAIRAIVVELVRRRDFILGEDEVRLLCAGLPDDVPARQLEGVVRHLELWSRMKASPPNVLAIREAIASIEQKAEISTDQVAKIVARRYKLKLADLKSSTRRQEVVRARSLAMFLSRQLSGSSYDKIGKYFGGRDHTTVLHACRKTETLIDNDSELRIAATEVTDLLKATA